MGGFSRCMRTRYVRTHVDQVPHCVLGCAHTHLATQTELASLRRKVAQLQHEGDELRRELHQAQADAGTALTRAKRVTEAAHVREKDLAAAYVVSCTQAPACSRATRSHATLQCVTPRVCFAVVVVVFLVGRASYAPASKKSWRFRTHCGAPPTTRGCMNCRQRWLDCSRKRRLNAVK